MENNLTFIETLNYRRSVRVYDKNKEIHTKIVKKCIEQATLAPNSSNMQLWEFHHITSKEIITKLSKACLGQSAATTTITTSCFAVVAALCPKHAFESFVIISLDVI